MKNSSELHLIFSECLNGFSPVFDKELGELFIKHLSQLESLKIEKQYIFALQNAKDKNLICEKDKEKQIILEGFWTKKEEDSIDDTVKFIRGIKESVSKEMLLSRRRQLRKEINNAEKRLDSLLMKKDFLIGATAEKYARQQSFYYQISNSFYKNEQLTEKLSYEQLQDEEIYDKLLNIYTIHKNRIDTEVIKNISISSFFTDLFYMCGDNAYYFYGKPIIQLTNYQSNLFLYGRYFKGIMSQYGDRLPKEMSENPDDMIEFFEITKNVEESGLLKDDGDDNIKVTSIPGATKEDLYLMGVDSSQITSVGEQMRKAGKSILNKDDLIRING